MTEEPFCLLLCRKSRQNRIIDVKVVKMRWCERGFQLAVTRSGWPLKASRGRAGVTKMKDMLANRGSTRGTLECMSKMEGYWEGWSLDVNVSKEEGEGWCKV